MALFSGKIGYAEQIEQKPGKYIDSVVEKLATGSFIKERVRYVDSGTKLNTLTVSDVISVMAGSYMMNNSHRMKYVVINGVRWDIESFSIEYPRIVLTIGGIYNGPLPTN